MEYQQILDKLLGVITPFAEGRIEVHEATELVGEMALDSLQVMDLTLAVEDEFDVSIPVNTLADVKTVGDLAREIQQHLK